MKRVSILLFCAILIFAFPLPAAGREAVFRTSFNSGDIPSIDQALVSDFIGIQLADEMTVGLSRLAMADRRWRKAPEAPFGNVGIQSKIPGGPGIGMEGHAGGRFVKPPSPSWPAGTAGLSGGRPPDCTAISRA